MRCVQLTAENRCALFGRPDRPQVCADFKAEAVLCGDDRPSALRLLGELEQQSLPSLN